jgi:AcrR family transcriptional regulator
MEKTPARQLILEAVVTCIEKYGIDKLTTRKIAQEAGTNIASINYYFRTKDDLVTEALSMTINHMLEDVFSAIYNQQQSFGEMLQEVIFYLIDGAVRFPRISTAHLYSAVMENRYDSPGAKAINEVFNRLVTRATVEYPHKEPEELRFLLSQIISAIMFTMLAPNFLSVADQFQPRDSEHCRLLAERYTKIFFDAL